ncbi:MAG: hypothetical protein M3Z04_19635, partial [Chloroflexota bacterium]|nr:hypothetical protein [Chloroflexota bacterium]
ALNVTVGPAPKLTLSGDTDPSRVQQQQATVTQTTAQMTQQGAQDAAVPMGEDNIHPDVPHEILKAEVGGAGGATGGAAGDHAALAGAAGGAGGTDAVSIIAQQQRGDQIRAAVAQGQAAMAAKRQEHTAAVTKEQAGNKQAVDKLIADNATAQEKQRAEAQTGVQKIRADWTKEQRNLTTKAGSDATTVTRDANSKVQSEQTRADSEAATHVDAGNGEIANARTQAEREAGAKREEAKGKSDDGGVFGWIADKVSSFFEGLKNAIVGIFDAARKLVTAAIDKARQLATAVIDKARQAVVGLIEAAGKALLAITDTLLAAFPALRDRFHSLIEKAVKAATDVVNKLAQQLKDGVLAALNLLGKALNAALGLLQQGLLSVLDTVKNAVKGAIDFAKAAIEALGEFASLVGDIAGNPGAWLHNLAAGVMDGLKNHLWAALKGAVQGWFHSKVDGLLGLGQTIWAVLTKGGISLAQVGKMAWEALKAAIPAALIQILVEKLVSMIVPAAGAIMAIIEGLRAAWASASRILQAMQRFIAFLKAVKSGNAGPAFGAAVAAGAVAVIDFVANWLLTKIKGAATTVGNKIKNIAQKILARLKKVGSKVVGAVKRGAGKVMHALGNTRVGQAVKRGYETVRNTVNKGKARVEQWQQDRAAKQNAGKTEDEIKKEKEAKLHNAVIAIRPKAEALMAKGVSGLRLRAQLAIWRIQHGLSALSITGGDTFKIMAKVNPEEEVVPGVVMHPEELLNHLRQVADDILTDKRVLAGAARIEATQRQTPPPKGRKATVHHVDVPADVSIPSVTAYAMSQKNPRGLFSPEEIHYEGGKNTPDVDVVRRQGWRYDPQNQVVTPIVNGKEIREGSRYEDLAKKLDEISTNSKGEKNPARIAGAIQRWIQTRTLPKGFSEEERAYIASMATLMSGQEAHRNPSALITSPMTIGIAREKGWTEAINSFFPMAPPNAQAGANALNSYLRTWKPGDETSTWEPSSDLVTGSKKPQEVRGQGQAMLESEVAVVREWVLTQKLSFLSIPDMNDRKTALKATITDRIFRMYGITPPKQ